MARLPLVLVVLVTASLSLVVVPPASASTGAVVLARVWTARDGSPANDETATALGTSPDGATVYVGGFSLDAKGHQRNVTIAYDAVTGARRWVDVRSGATSGPFYPDVLAVSPGGDAVFVGGSGTSFGMVIAYEAQTGAELWHTRFGGGDVAGLGVTPDGSTVLATGTTQGPTRSDDYRTAAFDATTGGQLWTARYDRAGLVDDAHALRVSPDGATVYVTGYSQGDDFYADYATIAYDMATGVQRWVARYNGPGSGYDNGTDLAVSPDGSTVVVTGSSDSNGPESPTDYATVAYDAASGVQRWASTYDDPAHLYDDGRIVRVSPIGDVVFVSGSANESIFSDFATVAYDIGTGAQEWVSTYDGPADNYDAPGDLVVSPDGSLVWVTGGSYGNGSGSDFATVTYDAATGTQEDVARIGTVGNDGAKAMTIGPDGSRLFVTGVMQPSSQDFGTVAYDLVP
jgi:hypothetical protein